MLPGAVFVVLLQPMDLAVQTVQPGFEVGDNAIGNASAEVVTGATLVMDNAAQLKLNAPILAAIELVRGAGAGEPILHPVDAVIQVETAAFVMAVHIVVVHVALVATLVIGVGALMIGIGALRLAAGGAVSLGRSRPGEDRRDRDGANGGEKGVFHS